MRKKSKTRPRFSFNFFVIGALVVIVTGLSLFFSGSFIAEDAAVNLVETAGKAQLFFQPSSVSVNPSGETILSVSTDKALAFAKTTVTFDKTKVKLAKEIDIVNVNFAKKIGITSMADANKNGSFTIVVALDPTHLSSAPLGQIQLAKLSFAPVGTNQSSVPLNFNLSDSQLVDTGAMVFTLSDSPTTLVLNGMAPSPTPSAISPTPVASSAPADSPIVSVIKNLKNREHVKPTVAIIQPNLGNSVNIGSQVTLSAAASDNRGVSRVVFYVNGHKQCVDKVAPYTCNWKPKGKAGKTDKITVRAVDRSGNSSSQTTKVTKK